MVSSVGRDPMEQTHSDDEAKDLSDFQCPICFDLLYEPVKLPCKHLCCLECFLKSKSFANLTCPKCRTRISSWARKVAKNGPKAFIDEKTAELIATTWPELSRLRASMVGSSESVLPPEVSAPTICSRGEIRSEYDQLVQKQAQEKKELLDADFALSERLSKEEIERREAELEQYAEQMAQDEALARRLRQELRNEGKLEPKAAAGARATNNCLSPASKKRRSAPASPSTTGQRNTLAWATSKSAATPEVSNSKATSSSGASCDSERKEVEQDENEDMVPVFPSSPALSCQSDMEESSRCHDEQVAHDEALAQRLRREYREEHKQKLKAAAEARAAQKSLEPAKKKRRSASTCTSPSPSQQNNALTWATSKSGLCPDVSHSKSVASRGEVLPVVIQEDAEDSEEASVIVDADLTLAGKPILRKEGSECAVADQKTALFEADLALSARLERQQAERQVAEHTIRVQQIARDGELARRLTKEFHKNTQENKAVTELRGAKKVIETPGKRPSSSSTSPSPSQKNTLLSWLSPSASKKS